MRSTSLIDQLPGDFTQFHFEAGERYAWVPDSQTITIGPEADNAQLLHELAHGLLGHASYTMDIALLQMERDAWSEARQLAKTYSVLISDDTVETALDSYRDWLHARSLCPHCHTTGLQVAIRTYQCLMCHTKWHVNDARICGLKRTMIQK